ncbi:ChaN family lipoprotein [Thermocrinis sp.]
MGKVPFRWSIVLILLSISLVVAKTHTEAEVIYLPEEHDSLQDHKFQEEVIRNLHQEGHKIVIAMEMFQQPFQKYIDDYLSGRISEEEMLEKTKYRERWGFPPDYYAPIWRFAREKGIRIYAINLPTELIRRIGREGLENVKDSTLPERIYEHAPEEKVRLRSTLKKHPPIDEKRFFDVQSAWDNGMAMKIVRILEEEKGSKVVVLIGRGHAYDLNSGVPRIVGLLRKGTKQAIMER